MNFDEASTKIERALGLKKLKLRKEERRFQAACAALQGILAAKCHFAESAMADQAVQYADALLERLEK